MEINENFIFIDCKINLIKSRNLLVWWLEEELTVQNLTGKYEKIEKFVKIGLQLPLNV